MMVCGYGYTVSVVNGVEVGKGRIVGYRYDRW